MDPLLEKIISGLPFLAINRLKLPINLDVSRTSAGPSAQLWLGYMHTKPSMPSSWF